MYYYILWRVPMANTPKRKKNLTEEQREELRERLEIARSAKEPSKQLSVHESIRGLPDTDNFAPPRVKGWIKATKERLNGMRKWKTSKDPKERKARTEEEVYLNNLQAYLRTGVYLDNRWGAERQHSVQSICVAMAYHADGTPKRTIGTWYPDIGTYSKEMAEEDAGEFFNKTKIHTTRRKNSKGT